MRSAPAKRLKLASPKTAESAVGSMSSNRWNLPTAVHPGACRTCKHGSPGANMLTEDGVTQTQECSLVVHPKLSARTAAPSAEARSGSESTASWMRAGKSCRQPTATLVRCSVIYFQSDTGWCCTFLPVLRAIVTCQHVSSPKQHAHCVTTCLCLHASMRPQTQTQTQRHAHAHTHTETHLQTKKPHLDGCCLYRYISLTLFCKLQATTLFVFAATRWSNSPQVHHVGTFTRPVT